MNTIPSSPAEHDHFLYFREKSVRIFMQDGVPLFALPDISDAFGLGEPRASILRRLPDYAKATCSVVSPAGLEDIDMLTPVGVWLYGHLIDPGRTQAGAAWARRESLKLFPDAEPSNPAMFITLEPDGSLPPRPMKYSGRRAEWSELKFSDERLKRICSRHLLPSRHLSARERVLACLENAA